MIDFAAFLDSLKYAGIGMAGVFVIIAILVGMVNLLQWIFPANRAKPEE